MTAVIKTTLDGVLLRTAMAAEGDYHMSYILMREHRGGGAYEHADGGIYSIVASVMDAGGNVEATCARDVASNESDALRLFGMIVDGAVTPVTLFDVVQDFAGE